MTKDSATLALVLTKAASHSVGLSKEAWGNPMSFLRGVGSAVKGLGRKAPAALSHPPPLPGASVASNVQAQMARAHAARGGASSVSAVTAPAAAGSFPRLRPWKRNTPIEGSYYNWAKPAGGWLDRQANRGWLGRAATLPFRKMLPGGGNLRGTLGLAGFGYGVSSANANRQLGPEFEAVASNAAAQALIQQRQWAKDHWFQNAFSPLASDKTVAQQLWEKNKPVAQAYWNQTQDPNHLTNVLQGVKQNHKLPWTSFF